MSRRRTLAGPAALLVIPVLAVGDGAVHLLLQRPGRVLLPHRGTVLDGGAVRLDSDILRSPSGGTGAGVAVLSAEPVDEQSAAPAAQRPAAPPVGWWVVAAIAAAAAGLVLMSWARRRAS